MNTEAKLQLRRAAINDLPLIINDEFGYFASGEGRYSNVYYPRDSFKSTILSLSKDQGDISSQLVDAAIKSQEAAVFCEGKCFNPYTEEAPGKKPHEVHTSNSDQKRLAQLRENGWPVFLNPDGSLGMVYYGAGDSTSLFNISVAVVFSVIEKEDPRRASAYLERLWPSIQRGLKYDIEIADIDGDGLIESSPNNLKALLNHTEKDSSFAYIAEDGRVPPPPYKYLSNNCYFLWSLRDSGLLAKRLGFREQAREYLERYQSGRETFEKIFWSDKLNYYVPLIDEGGNQDEIVVDDALEALWAVLPDPRRAQLVLDRLSKPDMMTQWGVRTRSSDSKQFVENGHLAYQNGLVWLHRNRILAEGAERYGFFEFARDLDRRIDGIEIHFGRIECVGVARGGFSLYQYEEDGIPAACKPQCWAVHGSLARTVSV